ncbi:MAG: hypothetical protein ACLFPS_02345 [Clostridia bacterium]
MSKYRRLKEYLFKCDRKIVKLSFSKVEEIVGFKLPESAYLYRAWWANSSHNALRVWVPVGWYVSVIDFQKKYVEFEKRETLDMNKKMKKIHAGQALELLEKLYALYDQRIIDSRTYKEKKSVLLAKIK